mgnify:CR=1 FL=1
MYKRQVVGWSPPPDADREPDLVLGQPDFATMSEFKNRPQGASRLRFPYAVALHGDALVVADTSNNRVLPWERAPRPGAGAVPYTHLTLPPTYSV